MGNLDTTLTFLRAFLAARVGPGCATLEEKDRGASAVELAIITAVILVIAGIILAAIKAFVTNESGKINGGG